MYDTVVHTGYVPPACYSLSEQHFQLVSCSARNSSNTIHGWAYVISNQDPRCTQKPIYTPIFFHHIKSSLLCTFTTALFTGGHMLQVIRTHDVPKNPYIPLFLRTILGLHYYSIYPRNSIMRHIKVSEIDVFFYLVFLSSLFSHNTV